MTDRPRARGFNIRINTPEHTAERPSWMCRVCGAAWPCDPAKKAMRDEAQRTYLGMLMWGFMDDFINDIISDEHPNEFSTAFERFIGWTR